MGLAAAVLILMLVGLPLVVVPSWFIGFFGLVAAALCAAGVAAHFAPLVTAGGTLATIEYTFAISLVGGPPAFLSAMAFGVTLFLLLQLADFMRKVHGTVIGASVVTPMIRYWLVIGAIDVGVIGGLAAGAGVVLWATSLPSHPAGATAVGALGAFVAAVGVLKLLASSGERVTNQGAHHILEHVTRGA